MAPGNILLVEDDDDIRVSVADCLSLEGYNVTATRNGQEALDELHSSQRPSLILLDLMMPVMSGQEFLEVKTKDQKIAGIPVVIVSAISDRSKIPQEWVRGFLKKPIDLELLLKLVKMYCRTTV